jgi:hypothetical protein
VAWDFPLCVVGALIAASLGYPLFQGTFARARPDRDSRTAAGGRFEVDAAKSAEVQRRPMILHLGALSGSGWPNDGPTLRPRC